MIDSLEAFLPLLVRRRWAAAGVPETARREELHAAVLFADVAGFTGLTDRFAARGAAGAEDLSRVLDTCFGRLGDLGLERGGDVVSVAGDALLFAWPATPDRLGEAVVAAAGAGLAMQEQLLRAPIPGDERLPIRVSVGAGPLTALEIGGVGGRWEWLLRGDPIRQIALADRVVLAGQVVVTPAARASAPGRCRGEELRGGYLLVREANDAGAGPAPPVSLPASAATAVRAAAPRVVADRIAAGQAEWIAEFRDVTILFVNLGHLDDQAPELLQVLQDATVTMQRAVGRSGGAIYQFLADDKGTSLVAAFGIPPFAHEDDAARAVTAAESIQADLSGMGFEPAIGLATGKAFCGVYGSPARRHYAIVGQVMNRGARLMQAASATILCDEATRAGAARARLRLGFRALPPVSVKGHDEPIAVFMPDADAVAPTSVAPPGPAPAIGRDREYAIVCEAIDRFAASGARGVLLIEGEAGIGKSCLAALAATHARARGFRVLSVHGAAMEQGAPYYPWHGVVSSFLGLDPTEDARARRRRVIERLAPRPELARFTPLLNAVITDLAIPDNETTLGMTEEARSETTRHLIIDLLRGSPEPTLLVLENAQWFDSASWTLASHAAHTEGLLVLLTTRPFAPEPAACQELRKDPALVRIGLDGLARESAAAIIATRLGVPAVPEGVIDLVHDTTSGNPYFAAEMALALLDLGVVAIRGGRCVVVAPGGAPAHAFQQALASRGLPVTVQGIVTARLDRLEPELQLSLRVASALGVTFAPGLLLAVYPIPIEPTALDGQLSELERRGLIRSAAGNEGRVAFAQAVTQEVVYATLPFAQRRELHRRAAEWYEGAAPPGVRGDLALLSYHWQRAGKPAKAVHYLEQAGIQAQRQYANQEAIGYFTDALETAGEGERELRARLELLLGRSYAAVSSYAEDRKHLEAGLALRGEPVPSSTVGGVTALLVEVVRQAVYRAWPERHLGRRAAEREALLERARALETLVETYFYLGDSLRSLYAAIRTLNVAESAGFSPELARGYAILGTITGFIPLPRIARWYGRRALEVVRQAGDPAARHWVCIVVGVSRAGMGDLDDAAALFEDARRITEGLGDRRRWADALGNLALVHLFRGHLAEATAELLQGVESAVKERDRRYQVSMLRPLIWCLIAQGRVDEAAARLTALRDLLAEGLEAEEGATRQDVHGFSAALALVRGDALTARHEVDAVLPALARVDPSTSFYSTCLSAAAVAETVHALWAAAERGSETSVVDLRQRSRIACRSLDRYARVFPVARPAALRVSADRAVLLGEKRKARRLLQASAAAAALLEVADRPLAKPMDGLYVDRH